MFFSDVDFSLFDEDYSIEPVLESIAIYEAQLEEYNRIKFLLEDEEVQTQQQTTTQAGKTSTNKIIAWIQSKIQAIIDFGRNLFSNNRFNSIKNFINTNMETPQIQVPKFLATIQSQMQDLQRYLKDIEAGNFMDRFNINIPSPTEMITVTKTQLLHIVDTIFRGQGLFNQVSSTFNKVKAKLTSNQQEGNSGDVLNALNNVMTKLKSIFKDPAATINSIISNLQQNKMQNSMNADGSTKDTGTKTTATKNEDFIFDNVFGNMIVNENRNVLITEDKERFRLLGNTYNVRVICENLYITDEQQEAFINLKNSRYELDALCESFDYLGDVVISKYIMIRENGDIQIVFKEFDDIVTVTLDKDLNIL